MSQIPHQKQNLKEQIQQLQKQALELDLKLLHKQTGLDQQPLIQKSLPQLQSLLMNKLKNQDNNANWPSLNPSNDITQKITKLQESYDEIESFTHQIQKKIDNLKQDESYFKIPKLNYQTLPLYLEKFNEFQLQSIAFSNSFQNKSYTQRFKNAVRNKLPQKNVSQQTFNLIETSITSTNKHINTKKSEQYIKAIKLQLTDINLSSLCSEFAQCSNLNLFQILSHQYTNYTLSSDLELSQYGVDSKRLMVNNTVSYLEDKFYEENLIKYLNEKNLVGGISQYLEDKYFGDYENGVRKSQTFFHDFMIDQVQISVCVWGVIYLLLRSGKYNEIIELITNSFSQQFESINQSLNFFYQNIKLYMTQNHILNDDQRYQVITILSGDMSLDSHCLFKLQVYDIITRRGYSQDEVFTKEADEFMWLSLKQVIVNQAEVANQQVEMDLLNNLNDVSPVDWYYLKDFQQSLSERSDYTQLRLIENMCLSFQYLNAFEQMKNQTQQGTVDLEDLIHFSFVILTSKFYDMRDDDLEINKGLRLEMQRICEMFISKKFETDISDGFYYSIFLYHQDKQILFEILSENIIKSKEIYDFVRSDKYVELYKLLELLNLNNEIQVHIADKLRKYKQHYSLAISIYDNFEMYIPMVQCITEFCAYLLQGDSNIDQNEYTYMENFIQNYFSNINQLLESKEANEELYKQIRIAQFMDFIKTLCIHLHKNTIEQGCQLYNFIVNRANDLIILPLDNNELQKRQGREVFTYLNQAGYLDFYLDFWVIYTEQAQLYLQQFKTGQFVQSYTKSFQQIAQQISFYDNYFNEINNNNEQEFNKNKTKTLKIKDKFLIISNQL